MSGKTKTKTGGEPSPATKHYQEIIVPAGVGLVVGTVLGAYFAPVISIGGGALTAIVVIRRYANQDYAVSGTLLLLGLWALIPVIPSFGPSYSGMMRDGLLVVGLLYSTFLALKLSVKKLIRGTVERHVGTKTATELWDFGVSAWGLFYIVWNILQLLERSIRSILIMVATPGAIIGNLYSEPGSNLYNLSMIILIISIMLIFHTLGTWQSASKAKDIASSEAKGIIDVAKRKQESLRENRSQGFEEEVD